MKVTNLKEAQAALDMITNRELSTLADLLVRYRRHLAFVTIPGKVAISNIFQLEDVTQDLEDKGLLIRISDTGFKDEL